MRKTMFALIAMSAFMYSPVTANQAITRVAFDNNITSVAPPVEQTVVGSFLIQRGVVRTGIATGDLVGQIRTESDIIIDLSTGSGIETQTFTFTGTNTTNGNAVTYTGAQVAQVMTLDGQIVDFNGRFVGRGSDGSTILGSVTLSSLLPPIAPHDAIIISR